MPKKSKPIQYRNKYDFYIDEQAYLNQQTIDRGSLWTLIDNKLVLVDDDNFVETDLDLCLFKIVE